MLSSFPDEDGEMARRGWEIERLGAIHEVDSFFRLIGERVEATEATEAKVGTSFRWFSRLFHHFSSRLISKRI